VIFNLSNHHRDKMKIQFPLWRGAVSTPQRKLNFHFALCLHVSTANGEEEETGKT
jgi:hypothetical protein